MSAVSIAQGEFIVPLATTEGTLVASYNRGMKLLTSPAGSSALSWPTRCSARRSSSSKMRAGTRFIKWVDENLIPIREEAEATSSVAKLDNIDPYQSNKFAFMRFNYQTGDAGGQNMVGRATFAACSWILDNYDGQEIKRFYLESNFATDKKASQVNIMRTRGKRVTAEAIVPAMY